MTIYLRHLRTNGKSCLVFALEMLKKWYTCSTFKNMSTSPPQDDRSELKLMSFDSAPMTL